MGDVTPLKRSGNGGPQDPGDNERWLLRQALVLAAQLPDNTADALRVIHHMRMLVEEFLGSAQRH